TSGVDGLPRFVLYARSMFDRFSQYVSDLRIELPGEAEFNRHFAVRGQDREKVIACITPEARELCRKAGNLLVEVQDGLLAVFPQNKLARPADYREMVAQALRLARALHPEP